MPILHCDACHHEWEGAATSRCDWCGDSSHVLEEQSPLEKMVSDPRWAEIRWQLLQRFQKSRRGG
jgi:hypothetical protein